MNRTLPSLMLAVLVGCRLPPENLPLRPLPEDGALFSYNEILTRARAQANAAVEAFYDDAWPDLEQAAKGLEQTARFLPKTIDQPPHVKDTLLAASRDLGKEAGHLGEAAQAKNINASMEVLQRITLQIRALRPKDVPGKEAPGKDAPEKPKVEKD